jgi:hypothetical protein
VAEIGKISSSEYAIDRRLSRFTWMPDERTKYETYVQALEFIVVLQAKARSLLTNGHV